MAGWVSIGTRSSHTTLVGKIDRKRPFGRQRNRGTAFRHISYTELMRMWSEWKCLVSNRCILSCSITCDWVAGKESGENRTAYFNTTYWCCCEITCKNKQTKNKSGWPAARSRLDSEIYRTQPVSITASIMFGTSVKYHNNLIGYSSAKRAKGWIESLCKMTDVTEQNP